MNIINYIDFDKLWRDAVDNSLSYLESSVKNFDKDMDDEDIFEVESEILEFIKNGIGEFELEEEACELNQEKDTVTFSFKSSFGEAEHEYYGYNITYDYEREAFTWIESE